MLISLNWIKKFTALPEVPIKDLALKITMSTVEVEGIHEQATALEGIVVGRIKELVKHPQADRLWICQTDIGKEIVQIVCGGSNLRQGMLVAVATVGSQVRWHGEGDLITLQEATIRGQKSFGMIVAATEIGLEQLFPAADDHEIIDLSSLTARVGQPLSAALGLDDTIIEIDNKSMTHRPDLWGHYGLARELAAVFDVRFKPARYPDITVEAKEKSLKLSVETKDCYRCSAILIDNFEVGPSPWWLRQRLEAVGLRSVNTVVDITNYVMLEVGHPMHAFDYDRIKGKISVRPVKKAEKVKTLNDLEYTLQPGTLVFADEEKKLDIAGIIGGQSSQIRPETKRILLTAANFKATTVRTASVALGLRTDASARYEKSLDPTLTMECLKLAVSLLKRLAPEARVTGPLIDINQAPERKGHITVSKDLFTRVIGTAITDKQIKDILHRLHFGVTSAKKQWQVTVPSWRATKDISIAEDLVEEVARIYGYDAIPAQLPLVQLQQPERQTELLLERQLKDICALNGGYYEVYNYSFAWLQWTDHLGLDTKQSIEVANAISADQTTLRTSLLPGLLQKVEENLRWSKEFKLFEMGRVYKDEPGEYATDPEGSSYLPNQSKFLAGVSVSSTQDAESLYLQVKGFIEHILSQYGIEYAYIGEENSFSSKRQIVKAYDQKFAFFGLLRDDLRQKYLPETKAVVWWELNFAKLVKHANQSRIFSAFPKFPPVIRDLAIVLDESISWSKIQAEITGSTPLIQEVQLFDVYQSAKLGVGKRSLAFSLTFRSHDRTLDSREVDDFLRTIMNNLEQKFAAQQR